MRTNCKIIPIVPILFTVMAFSLLPSCKKEKIVEHTITNTDTLYVTDTVSLFEPMTLSALTANKWMYQEIRGVRGGNIFIYVRGGSGNSENLDDEFIEFYSNNTANYHAQSGFERTITWDFSNNNSTITLHFTNTPANFDVHWENVRLKDNKWYFDEYYTDGNLGFNSHTQSIRIPKP